MSTTSTIRDVTTSTVREGVGGSDDTPPDEVVVSCDGTGARLSTKSVLTRPDGIHVTVQNTSDDDVSLNFVDRGDAVPPGVTETVQDMEPSALVISCGYDQNRAIVPAGTVEVLDPAGNWRPTDIDCAALPLTQWEEPLGSGSTPEEAVRWWSANRPGDITPINPEDEVISVGYPDAKAPRYVSRSRGHDTNIFQLRWADGAWHATPHENCPR